METVPHKQKFRNKKSNSCKFLSNIAESNFICYDDFTLKTYTNLLNYMLCRTPVQFLKFNNCESTTFRRGHIDARHLCTINYYYPRLLCAETITFWKVSDFVNKKVFFDYENVSHYKSKDGENKGDLGHLASNCCGLGEERTRFRKKNSWRPKMGW